MASISHSIGTRVKRLAKERGLSLRRLANELEVPPTTFLGWTSGRTKFDLRKIPKVARILSTTKEFLVFGEETQYLKEINQSTLRVPLIKSEHLMDWEEHLDEVTEYTTWPENGDDHSLISYQIDKAPPIAEYQLGDILLIDVDDTPRHDDIVLMADVNHDHFLRRYLRAGSEESLIAKDVPSLSFKSRNYRFVGVVIGFKRLHKRSSR